MAYAEKTKVSVSTSRTDIENIVTKYGASQYVSGWDENRAMIGFTLMNRQVRFMLTLPDKNERRFTHSSRGMRERDTALKAWEQGCRSKWRSLFLVIKAKLEAVEQEIDTFENAFMANVVLPNGQTVGDYMLPQIEKAYKTGTMPKMLPMLDAPQAT